MIGNLGIVDFRNIVKAIKENYDLDLANYALTSLKRRFEMIIFQNNLHNAETFVDKIASEIRYKDIILQSISIDETEMFRDPNLWQELSNNVLPKIVTSTEPRIWMPMSTSGDELFSLLITLERLGLRDKVSILVTSMSGKNLDNIKRGTIDLKRMAINDANYSRFCEQGILSDYYSLNKSVAHLDASLLEKVEFKEHKFFIDDPPSKMRLIIFRNKVIYFNQALQSKAVSIIHRALLPGGFCTFGIKENIELQGIDWKFSVVNKSEKIYKKVI